MAETFEAFGYQFEKLEKDGEVALTAADSAKGRFVIPSKVSYKGKTYTVVQIGGYRNYRTIESYEDKDPDDKRRKKTFTTYPIKYSYGRTIFNGNIYTHYNVEVTDIVVPDTVKTLYSNCFTHMWKTSTISDDELWIKLKSIKLSKNIKEIPENMCYGCTNLKTIDLQNIEIIDEEAFCDCINLSKIKFPSTLKNIGKKAFYNCKSLTKIEIPASVESIDVHAFEDSGIKKVKIHNKEGNVLIAENAFPEDAIIKYK